MTGLNHAQSADLVTDLIALSHQIQLHFSWRPNLRDESDNKFVEAAIHAAAIIVTYNINHFREADLPQCGGRAMIPQELVTRYF
jgi:predicted nucleic acid-binding protein